MRWIGKIYIVLKFQKWQYGTKEKSVSKEIIVENFPKFTKDVNFKIWESPQILSKINEKKSPVRHIVMKCGTSKHRDLKSRDEGESIIV